MTKKQSLREDVGRSQVSLLPPVVDAGAEAPTSAFDVDGRLRMVSIADTVALTGCSRSLIYQLIATGRLKAVKVGRRTLIPHAELQRWVESLPTFS